MRETVRRTSSQRRRKRKIQCIVRCSILFIILLAIIILIVFGIISCTSNKKKVSSSGEVVEVVGNSNDVEEETVEEKEEDKPLMVYPEKSSGFVELTDSEILSPYIAVIDVTDNKLIAGRNAETRIYPASMTKVMTLIVAAEHIENLDEKFTMTSEIIDPLFLSEASRAGFEPGEEVTACDLMYGLILPSGADGALGIAELVSGSEEEFVKLMNEKCEELGLENTHFMNTSGLHNENHYTTPVEMGMILAYAMENETCAKILSTYQYTTEVTSYHPEGILLTSTMFSRMFGDEVAGVQIKAGKTGYTQEARQCLVSFGESAGKKYVVVTAGAEGKWNTIYDDFKLYGEFCEGAEEEQTEPISQENS